MRAPIDAEQLDAFVTFAEHMNFTRAARARGVSQPALHTQVKKLSEALGVALYVRRGGKLSLTADGQRVLGFGRDARERMRAFVAELSHREVRGPLLLCAGEGAYLYLLGEGIRRFAGRGEADLRLLVRDHEGTVEAVRTGEAHLGVASLDAPPEGLRAEVITEVGQVIVLPAGHRLAGSAAVRLRDLAGERLVVPPVGRPHRTMIAQALRAAGVSWRAGVEASGWELLVRFAEVGLGLAIVNAFCRVPDGMVARPMPELPVRAYHLLQRPDAARQGPVASLAAALRETANAWRGIDARREKRPDAARKRPHPR
jgi:DNA-binding transcriptional LysR family regulator